MQFTSGTVISASQKSIVINVWSPNVGPTTDRNEEITLRLDSIERPLILKTSNTHELFIAKDDRLDVACVEYPDRLAVVGIRNVTDGSEYLVRTANVIGVRRDIYTAIFGAITWAFCVSLVCFVQRSTRRGPHKPTESKRVRHDRKRIRNASRISMGRFMSASGCPGWTASITGCRLLAQKRISGSHLSYPGRAVAVDSARTSACAAEKKDVRPVLS